MIHKITMMVTVPTNLGSEKDGLSFAGSGTSGGVATAGAGFSGGVLGSACGSTTTGAPHSSQNLRSGLRGAPHCSQDFGMFRTSQFSAATSTEFLPGSYGTAALRTDGSFWTANPNRCTATSAEFFPGGQGTAAFRACC